MIPISFAFVLVIVRLKGTTQNPEGYDTQSPTVREVQRQLQALAISLEEETLKQEKLQQDPEKAREKLLHPLLEIIMFAQVVRRVNIDRDAELLPSDSFLGQHFIMTDELYKKACAEIRDTVGYAGRYNRYEKIARHVIQYPEGDRREVNMVLCRAHPRPFYVRKVDNRNYMIYRETLDA